MMKRGKQLLMVSALAMFLASAPGVAHDDHTHGAADHANLKDERKALSLEPSERAMILYQLSELT